VDKKVFHRWTQINEMKPQRPVVHAVWEGIYLYLKLEIQRERERDWRWRVVYNRSYSDKRPLITGIVWETPLGHTLTVNEALSIRTT